MPTRSKRHQLLSEMEHLIRSVALDETVGDPGGSISSRSLDELVEIQAGILSTRYLHCRLYDTEKRGLVDMLNSYDDKGFKAEVQMDKRSFYNLVDMLGTYQVFHNRSINKQAPVWIQCFVAFRRLGTFGNANSLIRNAHHAGFSEGSIVKYLDRVVTAILSLHNDYIYWPNEEVRLQIKSRIRSKFGIPGAVGIIVGMPVILSQRPSIDGETFD